MLGDQLQQNVEALLPGERAIKFAVRLLGFLQRTEDLHRRVIAVHALIIESGVLCQCLQIVL